MEILVKENQRKSKTEFEKLLSKDLNQRKFVEGKIVQGIISKIDEKFVFVELGLKSEGSIPIDELKLTKDLQNIKVGEKLDVLLEKLENYSGELVISREKARKVHSWEKMEAAFEKKEEVQGMIISKCKGGFVVDVDSCLCFLPGSQIDLKPLKNIDHLMKVPQTFECVKLDKKRGNIVLSRRAILEKKRNESKEEILSKIKEGDIVEGVVKNLTDWGCFLDLNGIDALLHITDISWSRVNKPSELLSLSSTVTVKIIKIDPETQKVSVGIKQLTEDPYINAVKKFKIGGRYKAVVTKVQEYGCFAKLSEGLEGLIHLSELSWSRKNVSARNILSASQQIEVEVLEIDIEKRRISLSYKNTQVNPWKKFSKEFPVGSEIQGTIKNVADFGVFVLIKNTNLDAMIHYKDLSWSEDEFELKKFKKNDIIRAKVMEVDQEKEKIRLSLKHLLPDPFSFFMDKKKSDIITVVVKETFDNGIKVTTGKENFTTIIKKNQIAVEREDARPSRFARGDKIDAMIVNLDKNKKKVSLSIKALEEAESREAVKKYGSKDSGASLGDILGAVLKKKKK